jgi:molybdopterin-dependent oxidoreductase alpha subunit
VSASREDLPNDVTDVRVEPACEIAGGIPAVVSSMRHVVREMGLVRGTRTLLRTNAFGGFDCPGCAWPDPDHDRAVAEFCENGAKAVASEATTKRVTAAFFAEHSVDDLASRSDEWLNAQGRITEPMVLRAGTRHYAPISWDDSFALVATHLRALASPDEALFYTSGRTSNEAAFLYQLFVRQYGTNNLPDCSNMCHESSGVALHETLGVGKGTVTLDDFDVADAILIIGQNPGTNHPRMLTTLEKAARRGCTIVSINPLAEPGTMRFRHPQDPSDILSRGTQLASLHLPVRINGDVALLKGIAKAILEEDERRGGGVLDRAFIAEHTSGFDAYLAALRTVAWRDIVEESGVPIESIRATAKILAESDRTIACWAMGLTQHKNGVANIQEVVNVLLLRGNIGRPGAGVCPVRGHSNVQGDRTMGVWERMDGSFLDALGKEFSFEPPRAHGFDTVQSIHAMLDGRATVFFAMGGNFLSATPDTHATARALERCSLTAHVSTKLNRSHLVTGRDALILPCLGRTERDVRGGVEQFVTVENSMGVVHSSRGTLEPASPRLRSEVAIVAGLARAVLGGTSSVAWEMLADDYDTIRDAIERVVPGFGRFNERVRAPEGFHLPNAARVGVYETATKRATFTVHPLVRASLAPGRFVMTTIRSHDQYNTTVYGLDDRYRGVHGGRRIVLLNEADIAEAGFADGDVVDLVSHFDDGERTAAQFRIVAYGIPRRCAATYFPEANVLVPLGSVADKSNTPTSKSVVISLRRASAVPA